MSQNWEADRMLDVYIHDYLLKRNLQASAKAFQTEGKVSTEPVAIDAPGGFLYEWWSVFWDIFISRTNEKHSEVAASYIDTQLQKTREQHNQQQQHPPHQQQMQIQQMQLLQWQHAQQHQQQPREGSHHLCSTSTAVAGTDSFIRQNQGTVNAMATKIYEERLKLPHPRDAMDDTTLKRFGDNSVQHMDTNPTTLLKTVSPHGQPSGQVLLGSAGTNSTSMHQAFHHQLHGAALDSKNDMGMILNQRSSTVDPAMLGVSSSGLTKSSLLGSVTGVNQGHNTLPPLKGWPLTGIEQLRPGILQTQKSFMASPQALHQFQLLSPQQQQIVLQAQAQGNLAASGPLLPELESRRMQMMLNSRNVVANKDGQAGSASEISHSAGSPMQVQSPLSRGPGSDHEIFLKMKMAQIQQQRLHQLQQHHQQHIVQQSQSTERSEVANPHQDKVGTALTVDSSLSNSFRGNDQAYNTVEPSPSTNSTGTGKDASKGQKGRKRKQPGSSVGPAISNGTVNNAGPSPSSAPSTPSTQTPGDVMSIGSALHPSGSSSKQLTMYRQDGTRASPSNHLVDIDRFGEDGSLDDNVESFFHDDTELREMSGRGMDDRKGFSFHEIGILRAHQNKVGCCHFSSDGKLLASAGHDKKAVLWNMDTFQHKSILEEHTHFITDVRFSTGSYTTARLATSSFDRTVRVWETENASYSLRTFTGHPESVTSVDFHPKKDDLLCSCDSNNEIRLWNVTQGKGIKTFKGGMKQVRFQARTGRLLAAATENNVSIFDYEADSCLQTLKGHVKPVHSICWDPTGDYLASVSEDSARIWCLRSGKDAECVHDLNCRGRMSHSCVFHPTYQTILIIGCYQSLELWDMTENKTMSIPAHHGLIASLAVSAGSGMIASASHDATVKLWK